MLWAPFFNDTVTLSPDIWRLRSRRPLGYHLAVVDDHDPVAKCVRLFQVMSRHEDRGPPFSQTSDVFPKVGSVLGVQARARLVQKKDLRLVDNPQGQVQSPALAAGVGLGPSVGNACDIDDRKHLFDILSHL